MLYLICRKIYQGSEITVLLLGKAFKDMRNQSKPYNVLKIDKQFYEKHLRFRSAIKLRLTCKNVRKQLANYNHQSRFYTYVKFYSIGPSGQIESHKLGARVALKGPIFWRSRRSCSKLDNFFRSPMVQIEISISQCRP